MTVKILAQAISELIQENPSKSGEIMDSAQKLAREKYKNIDIARLNNEVIDQVALKNGIERYEVISATELTDTHKQDLERQLGGKSDITYRINTDIIGGIVIKSRDKQLDNSLKTKIKKYKDSIDSINNSQLITK